VSWLWTGADLIAAGLFFLFAGWLFPYRDASSLREPKSGTLVDPQIALGGALLLFIIGGVLVARAIVGKLRMRDSEMSTRITNRRPDHALVKVLRDAIKAANASWTETDKLYVSVCSALLAVAKLFGRPEGGSQAP